MVKNTIKILLISLVTLIISSVFALIELNVTQMCYINPFLVVSMVNLILIYDIIFLNYKILNKIKA